MLDLTSLTYFLSAYEAGTFSRAARANEVSQPTVSIAIQKLETLLGESLFQRSKSGLTPTALGERLYRDAAGSVSQLSALESRLRSRPLQKLRIYCHPDILLAPFAPTLHTVSRAFGNLQFHFSNTPENSDLAYTSQSCIPSGHGFLPIMSESYGVALPLHHPLARAESLTLEDLAGQPLIHRPYCPGADRFAAGYSDRFDGTKDGQGTAQHSTPAHATHDQQVLDLIAAGLGIALVPMSHGKSHSGLVVRPITGADLGTRTVGVSHRHTVFAADLAKRLVAATGLGL
ncbi:LysR family transcriptional regulator [Roseobacter sp. N2S]|uniref:LysR family transcriptional regulator n=1 Tax=Roseobacter sp. N2S TaxID=2663844 RepID=UPI00285B054B|nr:LysR family transcriptional regulator [Roseobacter sp. N2S]MDR6267204.1 DNA-binding transcriptional LysR family regulator [Roseobacter sp. N2S]